MIVEPVAGNMNCVPPVPGFLGVLLELCTQHGALLVFDEVMSGWRAHPAGAQQLYGVTPDLTCLGKVIGGATDSVVQSIILLALGAVLGAVGLIPGLHPSLARFAMALPLLAITTAALVSVGLMIGAMMESPEGFQLVSSFLLFPTFFLSVALFPLDRLPAWLAPLVVVDPLTYSVDALRHAILGSAHFALALDLGVMGGFLGLVVWLGSVAFARMRI